MPAHLKTADTTRTIAAQDQRNMRNAVEETFLYQSKSFMKNTRMIKIFGFFCRKLSGCGNVLTKSMQKEGDHRGKDLKKKKTDHDPDSRQSAVLNGRDWSRSSCDVCHRNVRYIKTGKSIERRGLP